MARGLLTWQRDPTKQGVGLCQVSNHPPHRRQRLAVVLCWREGSRGGGAMQGARGGALAGETAVWQGACESSSAGMAVQQVECAVHSI